MESFQNTEITDFMLRNGDHNQEDIDNESPLVWNNTMPQGIFKLFFITFLFIKFNYLL